MQKLPRAMSMAKGFTEEKEKRKKTKRKEKRGRKKRNADICQKKK
jgi:hypothetical protein